MGILTQEELEKSLFDAINKSYQSGKGLLAIDFFKLIMQYFDNNYHAYQHFLNQLAQKNYIKFEGTPAVLVIKFGTKGREWRQRLENAFQDQSQHISNQTFNISHANQVQAAGRDIYNFNQNDAERLIEVLKQVIPADPEPASLAKKVRSWLDCGASALEIIKGIASLIM